MEKSINPGRKVIESIRIPASYAFKGTMNIYLRIDRAEDEILTLYSDYNERIGCAFSMESLIKIMSDLQSGKYA